MIITLLLFQIVRLDISSSLTFLYNYWSTGFDYPSFAIIIILFALRFFRKTRKFAKIALFLVIVLYAILAVIVAYRDVTQYIIAGLISFLIMLGLIMKIKDSKKPIWVKVLLFLL